MHVTHTSQTQVQELPKPCLVRWQWHIEDARDDVIVTRTPGKIHVRVADHVPFQRLQIVAAVRFDKVHDWVAVTDQREAAILDSSETVGDIVGGAITVVAPRPQESFLAHFQEVAEE